MAYHSKAEMHAQLEANRQAPGAGLTVSRERRLHRAKALAGDDTQAAEQARRDSRMRRIRQSDIRLTIDAHALVKRLHDHVVGKIQMTVTQVRAATYLMDKVISDAPTEISVEEGALGGLAEQLQMAKDRVAASKAQREGT